MNKKQRRIKQKRQRVHEHQHTRQPQMTSRLRPTQAALLTTPPPHPIPLWTKTGELFQPVRVYYRLRNSRKIRARLATLMCLRPKAEDGRWEWLYTGEALKIHFEKAPTGRQNPVGLGTLVLWGDNGMVLDVHSIERALAAMSFFDRHLPRSAARISHIGIVNQLFDPHQAHAFQFPFCAASDAQTDDPVITVFRQFDRLHTRRRQSAQNTPDALAAYLHAAPDAAFPRIEHLALRFSPKRLPEIRFLLESRQYVAIQRWKGCDHFTASDCVQALMQAEPPATGRRDT